VSETRVNRRLAAIVAADVCGYSRLMSADEAGTVAVLRAHRVELINPAIEHNRGRVVKTTGDGLLAEFASVVNAVQCAVEIQRGMSERNAAVTEDRRIRFRIGINLGDIIVEDDDIYGDGVNVAARLENLAPPGGILVSRAAHDQVRDKLRLGFKDLGEQTVKNIARPVRVFAVDVADRATAAPRYTRSAEAGGDGVELLEREPFLTTLGEALEAARTSGRIALISGEAGIGKTSLVDRFAAIKRASTRVLWGACDSLLTPQPLGPLHDIAATLPGEFAERLRAGARPIEIFAALLATLREAPSLVIIEDVHWADAATLDLVKFMGRRIHQVPALLVLTFRDVIEPSHPLRVLLGDLATARTATRIVLPPLSAAAVRKLAGDRVDAMALHSQTGGNPFFVTEVLASGGGVPATVRDAVLARAARLSDGARHALETAAVIGARPELALLASCGVQQGAADECVAGGILRAQDDAIAFCHELARQAVLGAIAPQRLRALHARVLGALRALRGVDPAQVAHHADAAADAAAVRKWAPLAARAAAAAGAHREAAAQ